MKLITETEFNDIKIEESEASGDLYIKGIFMQADKKNRNGRIYPTKTLATEVNRYVENYVNTNRATGELNHPMSPKVNPREASHRIVSLEAQGSDFYGKVLVLETPIGNIVRGLIKGKVSLGVSSRGLGSLREGTGQYRGAKVIQPDFKLVTVDIVSDPSAPDAFVEGIYESVDYMIKDGIVMESDIVTGISVRTQLEESTKRSIERHQRASLLADLISKLKFRD